MAVYSIKVSLIKLKCYLENRMNLLTKQEELLMLTIFSMEEESYLVNIRDHLIQHAGKDWAFGSLYMSLEKLRKKGYVKTHIGKPYGKKPIQIRTS